MKIRGGFVSNSSSSSFIVKDHDLDTTGKVALMMVAKIAEEWVAEGEQTTNELERAIDFLYENLNIDDPICFPWSTNYETFIWRRSDGSIFVDTCNNNDWIDVLDVEYSDIDHYDIRKERENIAFTDLCFDLSSLMERNPLRGQT